EGKDIVAHNILPPVMLVKAGTLAPINDIVFEYDAAAPFIRVKAPASISEGIHIVNQIVSHDRPRLRSQCVDCAHIAQSELSNVVQMIELDDVRPARGIAVAPGPSN